MKCAIIIPFFTYFIFFADEAKAVYIKQNCLACCEGLSQSNVDPCKHSCIRKFATSQSYKNRSTCISSCRLIVEDCREGCTQDCLSRYPFKSKSKNKTGESSGQTVY